MAVRRNLQTGAYERQDESGNWVTIPPEEVVNTDPMRQSQESSEDEALTMTEAFADDVSRARGEDPDERSSLPPPGSPPPQQPQQQQQPFALQQNQIFPGQSPQPATAAEELVNRTLFGRGTAPQWGDIPFTTDWWRNLGANAGNMVNSWFTAPSTYAQAEQAAQPAAAAPAREEPEINLRSGELLPEDQAILEAINGLRESFEVSNQPQQLPPAPQRQEDPGMQLLLDRVTARDQQTQEWIAEEREYIRQRRERANNKWTMWGQFFSELGASGGRFSQAGVIMQRVLERNEDMNAALNAEARQLMQMGMSSTDAVTQATANLMSGRSQLTYENAVAAYNRDVAQIQLNQQSADRSSRNAQSAANLAIQSAEFSRDARTRSDARTEAVAGELSTNPEFSGAANRARAEMYSNDPGTQRALADSMEMRAQRQGLLAYIASNQSGNNAQRAQAVRFLRQWDPRLTDNELKQTPPDVLMMRLANSPRAQAAFQANPNLVQWGAYMPEPAE